MRKDALESLHDVLVTELLERIKGGTATAADLGVARQLLKDNAIDCVSKDFNPIARLAASLPFDDDRMDSLRKEAV
jgi:hypothetical protein